MAKRTDNKGRVLKPGESQRKDGTYMYRYTDQLKRRKSIYANSLTELRDKAKKTLAMEIISGVEYDEKITLIELVAKYNHSRTTNRISTTKTYQSRYNTLEKDPFTSQKAGKIKTAQAKAWLKSLYDEGKAASGVYVLGNYLKGIYRWGIENEIVSKNPFDFTMNFLPKAPLSRGAISKEELARYLEFVRTHEVFCDFYDYLVVLSETGLRLAEFLGLTITDVDFKTRRLSVRRQLRSAKKSNHYYIEAPKTETGARVVPITDQAFFALSRMIQRTKELPIQPMVDGVTGFIVTRPDGGLYSTPNFDTRIKHIRTHYRNKYGNTPNITPHVLRHTFCTELIQNGIPIPVVQSIMGHANASVTLQTYTHVMSDVASEKLLANIEDSGEFHSIYGQNSYAKFTPNVRESM